MRPANEINTPKLGTHCYEMGPIRPPSEGQDRSLLIRATRNCPWNRCVFCCAYGDQKFIYRSVSEIKADIDAAKAISDEIKAASWQLGHGGKVSNEVVNIIIRNSPDLYGRDCVESEASVSMLQCFVNAANWLISGARTVFLQDANSLIMRTPELVEVIRYLKETFPTVERITSYARSKTAAKKSLDELKELHHAGLSRLHIGLESGCNEVLENMQKGVTAAEHIIGGQKVVESGISLSEYVMPGLGGRKWSAKHAVETAQVLNEINPEFIRIRSLIIRPNSALAERYERGEFELLSEDEMVAETRLFIENLDCTSYVASDQMANLLLEIEGRLPAGRDKMLGIIDKYQNLPDYERLKFRLGRRLQSFLGVYGKVTPDLNDKVQQALKAIDEEAADATDKAEDALTALKQGFV